MFNTIGCCLLCRAVTVFIVVCECNVPFYNWTKSPVMNAQTRFPTGIIKYIRITITITVMLDLSTTHVNRRVKWKQPTVSIKRDGG